MSDGKIKDVFYEVGYKIDDKNLKKSEEKVEDLTKTVEKLGDKAGKTEKEMKGIGAEAAKAGKKGKKEFDFFNNSISDGIFGSGKLGGVLTNLGGKAGAIGLLTAAGKEFYDTMSLGIKTVEKSDEVLRGMLAREGKDAGKLTSDELKLRAEIGAPLGYLAEDVVRSEDKFSLAGFGEEKRMEYLPITLKAARSYGVSDPVELIDKATDLITPLGLDTQEKFANFLGDVEVISAKTNTSAMELLESLLRGGATGVDFGDTREQSMAILGILADQGLKGAEAGTAARNLSLSLRPTGSKEQKSILRRAGITEEMDTLERMEAFEEYIEGMSSDRRARIMTSVFGREGIVAAQKAFKKSDVAATLEQTITGTGAEVLDEKSAQILKGVGGQRRIAEATQEAAGIGKAGLIEMGKLGYYKTKTELYKGNLTENINKIREQDPMYQEPREAVNIKVENNFNGGTMGMTQAQTNDLNMKIYEVISGWFGNKLEKESNRLR